MCYWPRLSASVLASFPFVLHCVGAWVPALGCWARALSTSRADGSLAFVPQFFADNLLDGFAHATLLQHVEHLSAEPVGWRRLTSVVVLRWLEPPARTPAHNRRRANKCNKLTGGTIAPSARRTSRVRPGLVGGGGRSVSASIADNQRDALPALTAIGEAPNDKGQQSKPARRKRKPAPAPVAAQCMQLQTPPLERVTARRIKLRALSKARDNGKQEQPRPAPLLHLRTRAHGGRIA